MTSETYPWIPAANSVDRKIMLEKIGVKDPMELYNDVPQQLILKRELNIGFGRALSEEEIRVLMNKLLSRNKAFLDPPPFLGGHICAHYVPAAVDAIISRSEFYTAYTPYQPEINQGLLQALFEYQSLMADLLAMDVVNCSLYDGSTALAEAALMAVRVTGRDTVLVPETLDPEYMQVLRTWLFGKKIQVISVRVERDTGLIDLNDLEEKLRSYNVAAFVLEQPSFLGVVEPRVKRISNLVHEHGALLIALVDLTSLGLFKAPGEYDADIAVAEGQPFGLKLNYGGPYLGVFGVRWDRKLIRQLPGRLVGMTRTVKGERAFTLILQTREQHIKREKATSNITTNEALMAIAAAVHISLLGSEGIKRLSREVFVRSNYLAYKLSSLKEFGVTVPFYGKSVIFKNVYTVFPLNYNVVHKKLLERNIMGGLWLGRFSDFKWSNCERSALFCATEVHSKHHIDLLIDVLKEILSKIVQR